MVPFLTRTNFGLSALALLLVSAGGAHAQYPPSPRVPVVILGAPAPDTPQVPFLGARYSFRAAPSPSVSYSYYAPGYVAPQLFNPRYPDPGPYYSTATYPYVQSYYGYYYSPGYFRY